MELWKSLLQNMVPLTEIGMACLCYSFGDIQDLKLPMLLILFSPDTRSIIPIHSKLGMNIPYFSGCHLTLNINEIKCGIKK